MWFFRYSSGQTDILTYSTSQPYQGRGYKYKFDEFNCAHFTTTLLQTRYFFESCCSSRECRTLDLSSKNFTGYRLFRESSSRSQLWHIRYAVLLVRRIFTRCCRTGLVTPRRHCGRHLGHCCTYHELEQYRPTAVAHSVSLRQLYGTACPLTSLTLLH